MVEDIKYSFLDNVNTLIMTCSMKWFKDVGDYVILKKDIYKKGIRELIIVVNKEVFEVDGSVVNYDGFVIDEYTFEGTPEKVASSINCVIKELNQFK